VKDTLKWFAILPADYQLKTGLKPVIEKKIIEEWKKS
jgi:hypothetical protein